MQRSIISWAILLFLLNACALTTDRTDVEYKPDTAAKVLPDAKSVTKPSATTKETTRQKNAMAAAPLPSGSTINFEADRAAIEEAVTNYYDMTGYSQDFPSVRMGAELYRMKALTMSKTEGDRIEVQARYNARFLRNDGDILLRTSRFTLRKENNAYSVIAHKPLHVEEGKHGY